jgi:hypothetical protein
MNNRLKRLVVLLDVAQAYARMPVGPDGGPVSLVDPFRTASIRYVEDRTPDGHPIYRTDPDTRAFWIYWSPSWSRLYRDVMADISDVYTYVEDAQRDHPNLEWSRMPRFSED